ncbi:hypothetical protein CEXT_615771 [Caerostris extrusa]|uniref:Uncharacterized protein n=1 Tax=Caerostris extrusa TaxID=172846 RepID=A0AAV4SNB9_CAEEX|nr:hypothetical protein CEXT_615771 [Caerostris extrusa]
MQQRVGERERERVEEKGPLFEGKIMEKRSFISSHHWRCVREVINNSSISMGSPVAAIVSVLCWTTLVQQNATKVAFWKRGVGVGDAFFSFLFPLTSAAEAVVIEFLEQMGRAAAIAARILDDLVPLSSIKFHRTFEREVPRSQENNVKVTQRYLFQDIVCALGSYPKIARILNYYSTGIGYSLLRIWGRGNCYSSKTTFAPYALKCERYCAALVPFLFGLCE